MGQKLETLKNLLYEMDSKKNVFQEQPEPLTVEEKRVFAESLKQFSQLGESVYGKGDIEEIVERVKRVVTNADRIMTEGDDWMSNVAHKKGNKRMHEDYRDFEQSARELKEAQEKMAMCYENIGQHLSRYFDVQ